jgi:hypothetical protein
LRQQLAVYRRTTARPHLRRRTACSGPGWPQSGPDGDRPSSS